MADDVAEFPVEPTVSKTVLDSFKKTFITTLDDALEQVFSELPKHMAGAQFPEMKGAAAAAQGAKGGMSSAAIAGKVQAGANIAGMAAGMDVKGVLGAAGPWGQAAAAGIGAFQQLTDTIKQFVAIANPEIVEVFESAIKDISGVIGQFLTPVIEAAIPWVEMFGDFLASIMPDAQMLREALAPLKDAMAELKAALDPLLPLIKDELIRYLQMFAITMKLLVEQITFWLKLLGKTFNGSTTNWKSARGAAARGPAKYGSIESAGRDLQLAGFSRMTPEQSAVIKSERHLASIDAKTTGRSPQPVSTGNG